MKGLLNTELAVFPNKAKVGNLETKATLIYFQVYLVSAHYCRQTGGLFLRIKFYCSTTILIYLHTVCGYLCVSSQLNSCERGCMAYKVKHIHYLALYRKHFPTSDI